MSIIPENDLGIKCSRCGPGCTSKEADSGLCSKCYHLLGHRSQVKRQFEMTKINLANNLDSSDSESTEKRPCRKKKVRAPYSCSIPMSGDHVVLKNTRYQIGDIVSLIDADDGKAYYAQIRGFLNDQYSKKSAVITWLLPSSESPEEAFDPATYFIGPEEDLPRDLECMHFVCRPPSEYFMKTRSPFLTASCQTEKGIIWTNFQDRTLNGKAYKLEDCKKIASCLRVDDG